jgi:hypothetical protein
MLGMAKRNRKTPFGIFLASVKQTCRTFKQLSVAASFETSNYASIYD